MLVQWQEVLATCSAHECALLQLSSSMIKIGSGMIHTVNGTGVCCGVKLTSELSTAKGGIAIVVYSILECNSS